MEPRLGQHGVDEGATLAMPIVVAQQVQDCYQTIKDYLSIFNGAQSVADFLLIEPSQRPIIKRIQVMSSERFGDIRANLADKSLLPLDLLRCKLAFFGVSKFDPKSDRWVRNTMFQGAPTADEIGHCDVDDWFLPTTAHCSGQEVSVQ